MPLCEDLAITNWTENSTTEADQQPSCQQFYRQIHQRLCCRLSEVKETNTMNATAFGKRLSHILPKAIMPIITIALVLIASATIKAQQPTLEYGSASELEGVKSIFIYTGPDLEAQQKIAKHILKKLPHLKLSNSILEADIVLGFFQDEDSYLSGVFTQGRSSGTATIYGNRGTYNGSSSNTSTPIYRSIKTGTGLVIRLKPVSEPNAQPAIRLQMDFHDSKKSRIFEREPYTNFAKAFVKAYEKANKNNEK